MPLNTSAVVGIVVSCVVVVAASVVLAVVYGGKSKNQNDEESDPSNASEPPPPTDTIFVSGQNIPIEQALTTKDLVLASFKLTTVRTNVDIAEFKATLLASGIFGATYSLNIRNIRSGAQFTIDSGIINTDVLLFAAKTAALPKEYRGGDQIELRLTLQKPTIFKLVSVDFQPTVITFS